MENKKGFKFLNKFKNKDLIIAVCLGVLILILFLTSGIFDKKETIKIEKQEEMQNSFNMSATEYSQSLETRLAKVLKSMKGIENISVMVTVETSPQITVLKDEEEIVKNGNDGSSNIIKNAVIVKNGNVSLPIVMFETVPNVSGVLIICKGVKDVNNKLNIIRAVQVLFNLDATKIEVLEGV